MRLSDFTPRINGIVPAVTVMPGLRGLGTGIDPATLIATDLQSYLAGLAYDMENGIAKTPAQFQAIVQQDVASLCTNWASACGDYSSLIASAVSQYTAAYQAEYTRVTQEIAAGLISVPSTYVAPNALNTVAPNQSATSVTTAMTINNVSGGLNSQFKVGDGYSVSVSGPPNQPVMVSATKNGIGIGTSQVGTTDASGRATVTGVMGAGDIGTWAETWAVGGQVAGQISFTVVSASPTGLRPPVPMPPVTAGQVANAQTQGGSAAVAAGTSGSNVAAPTSGILDWLTTPISSSIPIPMWAVLAGGVVAFMVMEK